MSIIRDQSGNGIDLNNPLAIQTRTPQTVQTHNAVSVPLSSSVNGNWIDTTLFNAIALTLMNDGSTTSSLNVDWSNDGITLHGSEVAIASSTSRWKAGYVSTKARYARLSVVNGDAGAAHVMSAWAYLKVY